MTIIERYGFQQGYLSKDAGAVWNAFKTTLPVAAGAGIGGAVGSGIGLAAGLTGPSAIAAMAGGTLLGSFMGGAYMLHNLKSGGRSQLSVLKYKMAQGTATPEDKRNYEVLMDLKKGKDI